MLGEPVMLADGTDPGAFGEWIRCEALWSPFGELIADRKLCLGLTGKQRLILILFAQTDGIERGKGGYGFPSNTGDSHYGVQGRRMQH